MITRFGSLYLREEGLDDIFITSYTSRHEFEKKLHLNLSNVVSTDYKNSKTIAIDKNSVVLITTNQNGAGRGMNTGAEIYVKNGEEVWLLCNFWANEEVNDLRKTECYKLAEYIATRLAVKYGIEWEYKLSVDTPEKEKQFSRNVFIVILILIVTFTVMYYRLKYDMDHPKIDYSHK